jgi:hypothetical protein
VTDPNKLSETQVQLCKTQKLKVRLDATKLYRSPNSVSEVLSHLSCRVFSGANPPGNLKPLRTGSKTANRRGLREKQERGLRSLNPAPLTYIGRAQSSVRCMPAPPYVQPQITGM